MDEIGAGTGADNGNQGNNQQKEKMKSFEDVKVKVIFSSISYSTFCNWANDTFYDKNKPYNAKSAVLRKGWSSPDTNDYSQACDETIFVDCGSDDPNKFTDVDENEIDLSVYLSWGINRLRELLYRKSKEDISGVVHLHILAVHPCQKCMFALSQLLGKTLEHADIYASFIVHILSQPEYRYIFMWIQRLGWSFTVDYCAVFDAYETGVTDNRGNSEKIKEMNGLLGDQYNFFNFGAGQGDNWVKQNPKKRRINPEDNETPQVYYNGKWRNYDTVKDARDRLKDPSLGEREKILRQAKENQKRIEDRNKSQDYRINQAHNERHDSTTDEMLEKDIATLKELGYDTNEKKLAQKGFNPTQRRYSSYDYIPDPTNPLLFKRVANKNGPTHKVSLFFINGKYVAEEEIIKIQKENQATLEYAKSAVIEAEKAVLDKRKEIGSAIFSGIQIVIAIGGLACPILAVVDIAFTVMQWTLLDKDVKTMDLIGIGMDVASLIPCFGKAFSAYKVAKLNRLAEGSRTLSQADNALDAASELKHVGGGSKSMSNVDGISVPNAEHVSVPNAEHVSVPNAEHVSVPNAEHVSAPKLESVSDDKYEIVTVLNTDGHYYYKHWSDFPEDIQKKILERQDGFGRIFGQQSLISKPSPRNVVVRNTKTGEITEFLISNEQANAKFGKIGFNEYKGSRTIGENELNELRGMPSKKPQKTNDVTDTLQPRPQEVKSEPEVEMPKNEAPVKDAKNNSANRAEADSVQKSPDATNTSDAQVKQETTDSNVSQQQGEAMGESKGQNDAVSEAGGNSSYSGEELPDLNAELKNTLNQNPAESLKEQSLTPLKAFRNELRGNLFTNPFNKKNWGNTFQVFDKNKRAQMTGWDKYSTAITGGAVILIGVNGYLFFKGLLDDEENPDKLPGSKEEMQPEVPSFSEQLPDANAELERARSEMAEIEKNIKNLTEAEEVMAAFDQYEKARKRIELAEKVVEANKYSTELDSFASPTDYKYAVETAKNAHGELSLVQSQAELFKTFTPAQISQLAHINGIHDQQYHDNLADLSYAEKLRPGTIAEYTSSKITAAEAAAQEADEILLEESFYQYERNVAKGDEQFALNDLNNELFLQKYENNKKNNKAK